ncbi:RING-H2 finger protein ATL52-like protein [Tanacetum coccineum]
MLYYGVAVVATATIILAIYHIVMIRWCTMRYQRHLQHQTELNRRRRTPTTPNNTMSPPYPSRGAAIGLVPSFKYKKQQVEHDTECSVCLSVFEEGEEVRKLPLCDHCFHASCIDMWLYSHIHCPLCRTPVVEPPPPSPPLPELGSSSV